MACPFFEPIEIGGPAARVPLGRMYFGRCHAAADTPHEPDRDTQAKLCNHGYAHGVCERFPGDHDVDANRFTREPGGVIWIEEASYAPLRFGPAQEAPNDIIRAQLRRFEETK